MNDMINTLIREGFSYTTQRSSDSTYHVFTKSTSDSVLTDTMRGLTSVGALTSTYNLSRSVISNISIVKDIDVIISDELSGTITETSNGILFKYLIIMEEFTWGTH